MCLFTPTCLKTVDGELLTSSFTNFFFDRTPVKLSVHALRLICFDEFWQVEFQPVKTRVCCILQPDHSIRSFTGHSASVISLDFHPTKEDLICSCDNVSTIRYWSIKNGGCAGVSKVLVNLYLITQTSRLSCKMMIFLVPISVIESLFTSRLISSKIFRFVQLKLGFSLILGSILLLLMRMVYCYLMWRLPKFVVILWRLGNFSYNIPFTKLLKLLVHDCG